MGGRLDAVRVLEARLTLLTSIGADHEELLGARPARAAPSTRSSVAPGWRGA